MDYRMFVKNFAATHHPEGGWKRGEMIRTAAAAWQKYKADGFNVKPSLEQQAEQQPEQQDKSIMQRPEQQPEQQPEPIMRTEQPEQQERTEREDMLMQLKASKFMVANL